MAAEKPGKDSPSRGISLNLLNFLMVFVGVVIAVLMIQANYQTNENYLLMDAVINESLASQGTTGMMESISTSMSGSALAFIESGDPSHIFAYVNQLNTLNAEFGSSGMLSASRQEDDPYLAQAVSAFNAIRNTEWIAMRLKADTLPMSLSSLPEPLRNVTLPDDAAALSIEEKLEKSSAMLGTVEYAGLKAQLAGSVDASHRYVSEKATVQTARASALLGNVVYRQKVMILIFISLAVVALILNRVLVLQPINRGVTLLDRRESLPVRGSAEIRHLARVYNDVLQDNREKTEALSYAASHDALTGVYNRAAFDQQYRLCSGSRIGILVIDVDQFKHFNDDFGHDIGDRVLVRVSEALKKSFREEDFISRIGGDEFCVIMMDAGSDQSGRIRNTVSQINAMLAEGSGGAPAVTISVGAAFWDRKDPGPDILKDADIALLRIKKDRSSNYGIYGAGPG